MTTQLPPDPAPSPAAAGPPPPTPPHEADRRLHPGPRQRFGLWSGLAAFGLMLILPAPEGLEVVGWRTAALMVLMAVWWMTEAIPIPATALLPLVLVPLLGVDSLGAAAVPFANPLIFLFMGGFMVALAMERWGLHRRLALMVLAAVGVKPRAVVAGFMVAAAFLSMWISNTATALMMLPLGLSVVDLVGRGDGRASKEDADRFAVTVLLGIAYACSVGGIATLVGTPTNAVLAGFLLEAYGLELAFADWMKVGLPLAVVGLIVVYQVLTRWVFPVRIAEIPGGRAFIAGSLKALGKPSRGEVLVGAVFGLVAFLWMGRSLVEPLLPGLTDAGSAVLGAVLLFLLPAGEGERVLDWETARRLPWGVLLLFGGGLSLAAMIRDSGLAAWIGGGLAGAEALPILGLTLATVVVVVFLTELTSNTATAAAFLPILGSIAVGLGQNPLILLVPAAVAASCAFMLPVATPPNAIVYGSERITIPQMARAGLVLNLIFSVLVTLGAFFLLQWAFGVEVGVLPEWAASSP